MSRVFISYVNTENVLYLLNISSNYDTVDRLIFLTLIALHKDNKIKYVIIK